MEIMLDAGVGDEQDAKLSHEVILRSIFGGERWAGNLQVIFEYDHGDDWEHDITFLGKAHPTFRKAISIPEEQKAFCYADQGHLVAGNCGGTVGWDCLISPSRREARLTQS
ncbi:hypothetical protein BU25DRAFT_452466 [Macroventuria anomochaeta]|uniref:Uncharacterized protein n=1 Tax=Macroventuria anomochaeta TaxID=301207 RepID=A0ACB6RK47_9PLEO|nr:uncharacterized protein BU25DRAFT_452466 [Macroventuria anomochaeta]KAF2621775.1 hypothetical protein BU25DRAFT_452466 [Macroventuria anomochaeta]